MVRRRFGRDLPPSGGAAAAAALSAVTAVERLRYDLRRQRTPLNAADLGQKAAANAANLGLGAATNVADLGQGYVANSAHVGQGALANAADLGLGPSTDAAGSLRQQSPVDAARVGRGPTGNAAHLERQGAAQATGEGRLRKPEPASIDAIHEAWGREAPPLLPSPSRPSRCFPPYPLKPYGALFETLRCCVRSPMVLRSEILPCSAGNRLCCGVVLERVPAC